MYKSTCLELGVERLEIAATRASVGGLLPGLEAR